MPSRLPLSRAVPIERIFAGFLVRTGSSGDRPCNCTADGYFAEFPIQQYPTRVVAPAFNLGPCKIDNWWRILGRRAGRPSLTLSCPTGFIHNLILAKRLQLVDCSTPRESLSTGSTGAAMVSLMRHLAWFFYPLSVFLELFLVELLILWFSQRRQSLPVPGVPIIRIMGTIKYTAWNRPGSQPEPRHAAATLHQPGRRPACPRSANRLAKYCRSSRGTVVAGHARGPVGVAVKRRQGCRGDCTVGGNPS